MSNREMLELAAKAVGIVGNYYCDEYSEGIYIVDENDCGYGWSPHWDDGQALRLAVDLRLEIRQYLNQAEAYLSGSRDKHFSCVLYNEVEGCHAATRLSIVKVAAEIGKGMK